MKRMTWLLATIATALLLAACQKSSTSPSPPTSNPPPPATSNTSSFTVTFNENPVPFRSTGCSFSTPQGWYTQARVQETAGVAFTPSTLIQKLDGNVASFLAESFNSRFGACTGSAFAPGTILANGAVCGVVGVCATSTYGNYQFSIAGTDANGHALTFDSPLLQFGARPAGQSIRLVESSLKPMAPAPK